jgi:PAT family beta-lactamase induction signal transducer AmpG
MNKKSVHPMPILWVSTLYFAEGLPLMLVRYLGGVYLTDIGVRESYLGLLNLLGLPWMIKFLWAAGIDLSSTKRRWLLGMQAAIAVSAVLLGIITLFGPSVSHGATTVPFTQAGQAAVTVFVGLMVVTAFLSATHDIAIDGYYMDAIVDPGEQAAYTGIRVTTYRLAVIFAKSVLVGLAALFTWNAAFFAAGVTMLALVLFHAWYLPVPQPLSTKGKRRFTAAAYIEAFRSYLAQDRAWLILLFVATYKLGDEVLFSMNTPFLMRQVGLTKGQLSWISGIAGTIASIAGSLISAWSIKKFGLKKAIWPLTLMMNLNIWAYIYLAWALPDPTTTTGLAIVAGVHAYEQLASGLGNAVLIVYIMRTCLPEFKAAHYAIASALAGSGGVVIGSFSGAIVEAVGYTNLFLLSFAAALPSMGLLLVLGVPRERGQSGT